MGARIPEGVIDEIAARARIVEIVGDYVRLTRRGNRFLGLCPFHSEKTPSFHVNAERNLYHCFGCGASGNVYGFLMRHDGLSFPEAVRKVAERVGVVIPEGEQETEASRALRAERELYFEATTLAQRYFRAVMTSGRHDAPFAYLRERGIDDETAEAFGIGYAPAQWSSLVDALGKRGVSMPVLEKAGLAMRRREGDGYYDRFRDRVMFPVVSLATKVLAFSGRTLDPNERAKYVNSPETEFYTKGNELFGLHLAHRAIRQEGAAILVEGNFDVVSLHAHGLQNVCAPLGTAMTSRQARLLKRYTDRVVLLFDGDSAGRAAADKALPVLLEADIPEVLVVTLPDGRDPDDVVRTDGVDALRRFLDDARPLLDARLDEAIRPAAGQADIAAKRAAVDEVVRLVSPIRDTMVREKYVQDAARRLELDARALWKRASAPASGPSGPPAPSAPPPELDEDAPPPIRPLDEHEATLVEVLAEKPDLLASVHRQELHYVIDHRELAVFVERVADEWVGSGGPTFREAMDHMEDAALQSVLMAALVRDRGVRQEQLIELFEETVTSLKVRWLRREMRRLSEALRGADEENQLALMGRFQLLGRELAALTTEGLSEAAQQRPG